jgi:hypothetical protein
VDPRDVYVGGVVLAEVDHGAESLRDRLAEGGAALAGADWLLVVDRYPSLKREDDIIADLVITLCGRDQTQYWQSRQRLGGHPGILHARIGKTALAFARSHLGG